MAGFIARRLSAMVAVLLGLVVIEFVLQQLTPINPAKVLAGTNAAKGAIAQYSRQLYLNRPLPVRFWHFLSGVLDGNLGISVRTRDSVASDIATALPATIELTFFAMLFALILGALLGFTSASRNRAGSPIRHLLVVGASVPQFLLALLGIMFLSVRLGIFPSTGQTSYSSVPTGPTHLLIVDALLAGQPAIAWDVVVHAFMPAMCIALGSAVAIGRVFRGSLMASLDAPYSRTAVSKGLKPHQVILRHATRNSINPVLSMAGLQLGLMLAGVVIVEQIFAWPGLGFYLAQSIPANDFPAIQAATLILGAGYVLVNAGVDILQVAADPRIEL